MTRGLPTLSDMLGYLTTTVGPFSRCRAYKAVFLALSLKQRNGGENARQNNENAKATATATATTPMMMKNRETPPTWRTSESSCPLVNGFTNFTRKPCVARNKRSQNLSSQAEPDPKYVWHSAGFLPTHCKGFNTSPFRLVWWCLG